MENRLDGRDWEYLRNLFKDLLKSSDYEIIHMTMEKVADLRRINEVAIRFKGDDESLKIRGIDEISIERREFWKSLCVTKGVFCDSSLTDPDTIYYLCGMIPHVIDEVDEERNVLVVNNQLSRLKDFLGDIKDV